MEDNIVVHFKGGGSFVSLPPQFSSNCENVYVAWKNTIIEYSTKTGRLTSEFKGILDRIIGFSVHYQDSHECITACSESGEIITWKVDTHFKLVNKKIELDSVKTFVMVVTPNALISFKRLDQIHIALIEINSGEMLHYQCELSDMPYFIDTRNKSFFATCQENYLYIFKYKSAERTNIFTIADLTFTCISAHPNSDVILTGDSLGRVMLWQNLFRQSNHKTTRAIFHWHNLPVKSVTFSESGTNFYSGGDECVLVQWQVDNSHQKKFLPRLPSSIEQITMAPNNLYIAVATSDNAVRIVDSRFNQVSLIQHLVIGDYESGVIILDPRTRALVMNGHVGHVQFYTPHDGNLLYSVDVVGQNQITNERNANIENTKVVKVALSTSGLWMATFERRLDDCSYSNDMMESRLKFWQFDRDLQNFKLNTSIESPHVKGGVHALEFQPVEKSSSLKCVTVGCDGKFKVWQLGDASTIYNKTAMSWRCLYTGFYRDLTCRGLSFSVDGSLVAIGFGAIVTTWLPDSCELRCSLVHPYYNQEEIEQVRFGNGNQCHLVVAASHRRLSVWNLLTLTMSWTVYTPVAFLISDPVTPNMAVITRDKKLFVFTPQSPEPVFSSRDILEDHPEILATAFVPNKFSNDARLKWHERCPIYFVDSNRELFSLGSDDDSDGLLSGTDEELIEKSVFGVLQPKSKVHQTKNEVNGVRHMFSKDSTQNNLKKYLEAPIHTMIPIRLRCRFLLQDMVLQKLETSKT